MLPGFGGLEDNSRATYSVDAKLNSSFGALSIASVAMRKNGYKLIYYKGYKGGDSYELYDLQNDPEELSDLFGKEASIAGAMRDELLTAFDQHSGPVQG